MFSLRVSGRLSLEVTSIRIQRQSKEDPPCQWWGWGWGIAQAVDGLNRIRQRERAFALSA